jgi:hypothetical protein
MVDPIARTLEIHRLVGAQWTLVATHAGSAAIRAEPFAEVEIDTARWWPDA